MALRDELRQEIADTGSAFHRLLDDVPDEALVRPSDNPAWTVGEVLYHMSLAPRLMVADVALIVGHPVAFRRIARVVPQAAFDWANKVYTRSRGRRLTRAQLAGEYDRATARILATLDSLPDEAFDRSAVYPGWDPLLDGVVTVERLFHYVRAHFSVHEQQIRSQVHPAT